MNRRKSVLWLGAILVAAGLFWLALDVLGFGLKPADLREFDPDAVAV